MLLVAALDGRDRPAEGVDLVELRPGRPLQLVRQRLDEVRAGQRVGRLGDPGLVGEDLLGPQRETGRLGRRQGERLVA